MVEETKRTLKIKLIHKESESGECGNAGIVDMANALAYAASEIMKADWEGFVLKANGIILRDDSGKDEAELVFHFVRQKDI